MLESVRNNSFTTDRSLSAYRSVLGEDFPDLLHTLGPGQHWIDAGAGEAIAQQEYLAQSGARAARTTAVGMVAPTHIGAPGLRYLAGTALEDLEVATLGSADLLTDVFGPLQYAVALDRVMARYLELLTPGGWLWATVPVTTYMMEGKKELGFVDWVRRMSGFAVLRLPDPHGHRRAMLLQRDACPARVPRLAPLRIFDGPPPYRVYRQEAEPRPLVPGEMSGPTPSPPALPGKRNAA